MTMKLEEIIDDLWYYAKQYQIILKGNSQLRKHLDTTKAVCVWVAKDMTPILSSCVTLRQPTQTECYCISQSLFCSHWIICMLLIYSNTPESQLSKHSDLSFTSIWGHLSEIDLSLTEDQFFFNLKIDRD